MLDTRLVYIDYAHTLRSEAYGGSAACLVFAPACPVVYAAVVPYIEKQLDEYKIEVEGLKKKILIAKSVARSVTELLTAKDEE